MSAIGLDASDWLMLLATLEPMLLLTADATETETVWDMIAADIVRMRMRTSRKLLIVA